ncbi:hypothetical protein C8R45DRAFT_1214469 [Mycena sanguinolenta]|nr:hypothetical protein C8R45DRAFT_1214469 [Mycena sanguinolenta]
MSHIRQTRAHGRHALRAGGFGGLGGFGGNTGSESTSNTENGDSGLDSILSDLGIPVGGGETKTKTSTTATSTTATSTSSTTSATSTASSLSASSTFPSSFTTATSSTTTTSSKQTTTSTTTHHSIPITTTASGTALHNDITITRVSSVTAQAAAADSSNPAVPTTSNALVAPVVGGVAGGIVGLALLVFLITWFFRRRRPDQDAINFDPGAFRRSAMLIQEPPTHQDTVERGYNPANPPAMVERRPVFTQASFDNTVGVNSPTSGSQLVFQAPYSPITPSPNVSSPVSAYDHHTWGPVSGAAPVLTRNTSGSSAHSAHSPVGAPQYAAYPVLPSQPLRRNSTTRNGQLAPPQESEYLDLERTTSVTPFQAEQYVEISKQLNTDVPRGLDTPTVSQIVAEKMDLPPLPAHEDPFTDGAADEEQDQEQEPATLAKVQDMYFPAPPSPALSSSSRYARERVESMPPTLPEIIVQSRVSTSAYLSDAGSPAAGQTVFAESPMGTSRFPVTPSPLASSFSVPSPPAAATSFPEAVARSETKKNRDTMYSTIYDPEDAYGGM